MSSTGAALLLAVDLHQLSIRLYEPNLLHKTNPEAQTTIKPRKLFFFFDATVLHCLYFKACYGSLLTLSNCSNQAELLSVKPITGVNHKFHSQSILALSLRSLTWSHRSQELMRSLQSLSRLQRASCSSSSLLKPPIRDHRREANQWNPAPDPISLAT